MELARSSSDRSQFEPSREPQACDRSSAGSLAKKLHVVNSHAQRPAFAGLDRDRRATGREVALRPQLIRGRLDLEAVAAQADVGRGLEIDARGPDARDGLAATTRSRSLGPRKWPCRAGATLRRLRSTDLHDVARRAGEFLKVIRRVVSFVELMALILT